MENNSLVDTYLILHNNILSPHEGRFRVTHWLALGHGQTYCRRWIGRVAKTQVRFDRLARYRNGCSTAGDKWRAIPSRGKEVRGTPRVALREDDLARVCGEMTLNLVHAKINAEWCRPRTKATARMTHIVSKIILESAVGTGVKSLCHTCNILSVFGGVRK